MAKILIFDSKVIAETAIPMNQIKRVKIAGKEICLTRTAIGFFAFEKDCPHMTDDLSRGKVNHQNEVVCPWHAYRFSLKTGEESGRRCGDLKIYALVWEEGKLHLVNQ